MDEPEFRKNLHEINNHLTVVVASAELALLESPPDSQHRSDLEHILEAALKARVLLEDLRTNLVGV